MSEKPSVTLAGDWSKPAQTLIEKIADAVGGIAAPYQIVRIAKAEVKADQIRERGSIEVENIQRRALRRFRAEETKKQANMEQIIRDALPMLEEKSQPQNVSDDWITNFFDKCRMISDEDMQRVWSKILAREANSPGVFARKTVNILADLDKSDAELFSKLCGFVWELTEGPTSTEPLNVFPLVLQVRAGSFYSKHGIDFESLTHLDSLSLIRFDPTEGFAIYALPSLVSASYFGKIVSLRLAGESAPGTLDCGHVLFTRAGIELRRVCSASPAEGFFEFTCDMWKRSSRLATSG